MARRHGHRGTAALVNAVLRRLAEEGPPPPPDAASDPIGHLAVVYSHPAWLVARWAARWGLDEARALAAAHNRPAPSALRVNTLRAGRDEILAGLVARGIDARPGLLPEAVRVSGSLVERLPLVDQGLCVAQDEGAMMVGLAVAPPPGGTVIDACSAPGGKTFHLAALMGNAGRLVACDVHPRKLQTLARRATVMGATCVEAHHLDAREIGGRWPDLADAVLVDAPCSGLGTLRRRPEIKWRAAEADLARHAAAQRAILCGAAGAVRPGGLLVYSVCSIEPEEGPRVVEAFLAAHPWFARAPLPGLFPRALGSHAVDETARGEVLLLPHRHDVDGFYIARLRRG
jgi:16S rRNA (cytosine967-C5)-methyltransferase